MRWFRVTVLNGSDPTRDHAFHNEISVYCHDCSAVVVFSVTPF